MSTKFAEHETVLQLGLCRSSNDATAPTWNTSFTDCGLPEPRQADSSMNIATERPPYTCYANNADSDCLYKFNNICEVNNGICTADCFDCDPCLEYRFDGCEACTAANCIWCGADAVCVSPDAVLGLGDAGTKLSCTATDFVSTCPLNTGLDPIEEAMGWVYNAVNVRPAWDKGYGESENLNCIPHSSIHCPLSFLAGKGVGIRVNDDGLDVDHPEIGTERFSENDSCYLWTPIGFHGTAIASMAAGSANNGVCGKGIAFEATLSACRVLETESGDFELAREDENYAFLSSHINAVDIMINSFGDSGCVRDRRDRLRRLQTSFAADCPFSSGTKSPCSQCLGVDWNSVTSSVCLDAVEDYCSSDHVLFRDQDIPLCHDFLHLFVECAYTTLNVREQENLLKGITNGRGGKGIIYFWASGNDFDSGANVNTEGILISRYIIPVAATGKDNRRTSFSTGGAALIVTAPGGDFDHFTNSLGARAKGSCMDIGAGKCR